LDILTFECNVSYVTMTCLMSKNFENLALKFGNRTSQKAMELPFLVSDRHVTNKPNKVLEKRLSCLSTLDDVVYIKRKPPTKRREAQTTPMISLEVEPPVTGSPVVIVSPSFWLSVCLIV